jgi:tRNA-2-methylthio-N6-dimethylallyladenosine synthase
VLIESPSKKSDLELMGRTTCNRVVVVPADPRWPAGTLVTVRVAEVSSFTLRGVVTHVEGRPV